MADTVVRWVLFTDLDGTLLDHGTYRWWAAWGTLELTRRRRVPLVIVTSKTRAEVLPILRSLRRREPFVVENGGAIYVPTGYFPFSLPGATQTRAGWLCNPLGTSRGRLLSALRRAAARTGARVRSFADMTVEEVAERTALRLTEARQAREREFDEPFVILENAARAWPRLRGEILRRGLNATRGSRFFHILGNNDKGVAVWKLTTWLRRAHGREVCTIGLGDSPNDIPLLQAVDLAVIVARPGGRYDRETLAAVPRAQRAGGVGPEGWNRAVLRLLGSSSP